MFMKMIKNEVYKNKQIRKFSFHFKRWE